MSSSSSSNRRKKRRSKFSHQNASLDLLSSITSNSNNNTYTNNNNNTNNPNAVNEYLSSSIATLEAELEKLKSLRRLDEIKSSNALSRYRRHVASLEEDAEEARSFAEEVERKSEEDLERMAESRGLALRRVRELERTLEEERSVNRSVSVSRSVSRSNVDVVDDMDDNDNDDNVQLLKRKNEMLEGKVEGMEEELKALRDQNQSLMDIANNTTTTDNTNTDTDSDGASPSPNMPITPHAKPSPSSLTINASDHTATTQTVLLSPSPPEIITELNKTRLSLSDALRHNRSLALKLESLRTAASQRTEYKESLHLAERKVEALEEELGKVRREREGSRVLERRWEEFRMDLIGARKEIERTADDATVNEKGNHDDDENTNDEKSTKRDNDENAPPEIATVIRHVRTLTARTEKYERSDRKLRHEVESLAKRNAALEIERRREISSSSDRRRVHEGERAELVGRVKVLEDELDVVRRREGVWRREADGMRELLGTYKDVEDRLSTNTADGSSSGKKRRRRYDPSDKNDDDDDEDDGEVKEDATTKGLSLSLQSARAELEILQEQNSTLKLKESQTRTKNETLEEELTNVKTKFGKLREALYAQRSEAVKAEERAVRAESMAGKGSFDVENVRALHSKKNPLMDAVREKYTREIDVLKLQLEKKEEELSEARGDDTKNDNNNNNSNNNMDTTTEASALDAQKLNKRLKESFREQIGLFREGVYLITGYKIDMINTESSSRPQFKVRSMFAERQEDHLMFSWPKLKEGESPSSLDILGTDLAKVLSKEDAFQYMTKFKSLPAFMASVCLTLFERQTISL